MDWLDNPGKLGQEIKTAIKIAQEDERKVIVAQAGKHEEQEERPLDVREQTLANARALWPVLEAKKPAHVPSRSIKALPEMEVLVVGTGTTIFAAVVRNNLPGCPESKCIFMRSDHTDTVKKSVQMLLELTMVLLNKEFYKTYFREQHDAQIRVEGKGFYY
ncbi:hypothetical protein LTR56_024058 [Elasticomyces elasticus]|nr:hypothetical protein LTR56_024058 [Elasticomyces elasticus]KAK3666623.1 hypothetical protein LTR22_002567 [Elasticomyces elasticus]KAK4921684.1 hypothetical protein LTR49_010975 [Elasticomyces elasticus]KAK5758628.1 hypothetical protein LTS12_011332 [Elasticomyces elasticus]